MKTRPNTPAAATIDPLRVGVSGVHGLGVFAARALRAGQALGAYAGRRYASGAPLDATDDQLTYLFGLSDGSTIDGAQGGNATRHINHACEPNVEAVETYDDAGELVVVIRATRRIRRGEELFLDYALDVDGDDPAGYPCRCGTDRCRGTLVAAPAAGPLA